MNNNIKHLKNRRKYPKTNGVVETVYKEIRKYVILKYAEDSKDFDLYNILLEAINTHNNNIHTTTGFKQIDIINNTDDEINNKVLLNIEHSLKYNNNYYDNIITGNHILINKRVNKSGKKN